MATPHRDSRARLIKRAIESASQYNMYLNKQRRYERPVCMDLQTDTVNYPVGLGRQNKTLKKTNKIGKYPVALLPCQYQDWYVTYDSEEMKYLPLNTVLYGPIVNPEKLPPVLSPEISDFSDSDSSCSSNDSHSTHDSCSNSNCDSNNEENDDDNRSLLSSSSNSSQCSSCANKKRRKKVTIQWSRTPSPPHLMPIEEDYSFQVQYLHP